MIFQGYSTAFFKKRVFYDVSPVYYRQGCQSKHFCRTIVCQGSKQRIYYVDWLGNTLLEKKHGEAVVSWVNVLGLGPFAYEKRHAACWGVLWGSLMLEGNIFFFFCFILYSHPVYQTHLPLFFSLPSIVVQHRPANKKVPNKDKKPNT